MPLNLFHYVGCVCCSEGEKIDVGWSVEYLTPTSITKNDVGLVGGFS